MITYVVGFLFSPSGAEVVLIRKARPSWQSGLLNGIGGVTGQVERTGEHEYGRDGVCYRCTHSCLSSYSTCTYQIDEPIWAAMQRKWKEETGDHSDITWKRFGSLHGIDWRVNLFAAIGDVTLPRTQIHDLKETEPVFVYNRLQRSLRSVQDHEKQLIAPTCVRDARLLHNVEWLIPQAWSFISGEDTSVIEMRIHTVLTKSATH
jgi:hypothetical protein